MTTIESTNASGRQLGSLKTAAKRLGLSLNEYLGKLNAGEKNCHDCKQWKRRDEFNADRSRGDGLQAICRSCASTKAKTSYKPQLRLRLRGFRVPTRDGDKLQARRRINYLVEQGLIPHPDDLPCHDCADGVFSVTYRHEYDHARGYDGENQLYVEAVCSKCHHNREDHRRGR